MRWIAPMVVMLLASAGCSSDSCTGIGCSSSALLTGELAAPSGPLDIEACVNQRCTELKAVAPQGCHSAQGSPRIEACFTPTGGGVRLDVTVHHDVNDPPLGDGDAYALNVQDGSGASLVAFTGNATYSDYRPNGAGCDPVCKSAELGF